MPGKNLKTSKPLSGDITITTPLLRFLPKMKGGEVIEKFFIKDFLSKKFSGASRRSLKGGGVVIVISPDIKLRVQNAPPLQNKKCRVVPKFNFFVENPLTPSIFSIASTACLTTSTDEAVSLDNTCGLKNGTSPPYFSAIWAISSESVETMDLVKNFDFIASSIV